MDIDIGGARSWLIPVLAFLGAALGGVVPQVISNRQQNRREQNNRRRETLTSLQSVMETHSLTAVAWFNAIEQRFHATGHWQPIGLGVPHIPGITDRPLMVSTRHLAARVPNDELRRLVREHAEAIGAATVQSKSHEEASEAIARVGERYTEVQTVIETLLDELP